MYFVPVAPFHLIRSEVYRILLMGIVCFSMVYALMLSS